MQLPKSSSKVETSGKSIGQIFEVVNGNCELGSPEILRHLSPVVTFIFSCGNGFQGVAQALFPLSAGLCDTRILNTHSACESSAGTESKPSGFVSHQNMKVSQERYLFQPGSIFKLPFHSNLTTPSKPLLF